MTEVVRTNFAQLYPHIEDCISKCDFIAIDTEFTGFLATPEDERSLFDTLEQCYQKLRRLAQTYFICQFGLSVFIKDKDSSTNRYLVHTFNFYTFPRSEPIHRHVKVGIQASNADFLCQYKFDFNKLFYEGISYLNRQQEEELLDSVTDEQTLQEALGFTRVFRLIQTSQKPLIGHNLLTDLMLMCEMFHRPLPKQYCDFKSELHRLFPMIIDTKSLCYAVQKQLSRTNLVEFSNLVDLYEALGSNKGTFYVLCAPDMVHADPEVAEKYAVQKLFHEAGFDAFCAGFIFLRIAHLLAMKGIESTSARPVHIRQYFRSVEPYTNRVNIIRGPINYINLGGADPPQCRSDWLVVRSKNGEHLTPQLLKEYLDCSMDMRPYSSYPSTSAVVVLSSQRRAQQLLMEGNEFVTVRRYWWLPDSLLAGTRPGTGTGTGPFIITRRTYKRLLIPGLGIGLLGMGIGLLKYYWKVL